MSVYDGTTHLRETLADLLAHVVEDGDDGPGAERDWKFPASHLPNGVVQEVLSGVTRAVFGMCPEGEVDVSAVSLEYVKVLYRVREKETGARFSVVANVIPDEGVVDVLQKGWGPRGQVARFLKGGLHILEAVLKGVDVATLFGEPIPRRLYGDEVHGWFLRVGYVFQELDALYDELRYELDGKRCKNVGGVNEWFYQKDSPFRGCESCCSSGLS